MFCALDVQKMWIETVFKMRKVIRKVPVKIIFIGFNGIILIFKGLDKPVSLEMLFVITPSNCKQSKHYI